MWISFIGIVFVIGEWLVVDVVVVEENVGDVGVFVGKYIGVG